jgi:hypothetical protein
MNEVLKRDAGSPGRNYIASATKELSEKLTLGKRKGWEKDYLREIRDTGIDEIEKEYSKIADEHVAKLESELGEYEKIYRQKFESNDEIRFHIERAQLRFDSMTDDELQGLYIQDAAGKSGLFRPEEKEVLARTVKQRLGDNSFLTLRKAHREQRYDEPWRKLAGSIPDDLATMKNRAKGYFLSRQTSEKNPGATAWFPVRIESLVDSPDDKFN